VPEPSRHFAVDVRPSGTSPRANALFESRAHHWAGAERARLCALAAVLIPATDTMPGADEVGVADDLLDAVLNARPDLVTDLRTALSVDIAREADAIEHLQNTARSAYRALVLVVLASYYRSSEVQRRIGYRGQEPRPVGPFAYPEYLAEGLLDHLVQSGAP
jgi:hypothetical protein